MGMSLSKLWSWWWTGRPGVLRFMGSQRVGHNWATELNWPAGMKTERRAFCKIPKTWPSSVIKIAPRRLCHSQWSHTPYNPGVEWVESLLLKGNRKHKHVRTGIMAEHHFPLFSAEIKSDWGYSSKHQLLNIFLNTLEKSKLFEWQKLTARVAVVTGCPWAKGFTVSSWWWRAHEITGVHTGHLHPEQVQMKLQEWS